MFTWTRIIAIGLVIGTNKLNIIRMENCIVNTNTCQICLYSNSIFHTVKKLLKSNLWGLLLCCT